MLECCKSTVICLPCMFLLPVCQIFISVRAQGWMQMSCMCIPLNSRVPKVVYINCKTSEYVQKVCSRSRFHQTSVWLSLNLSFVQIEVADTWRWCFYENRDTFTHLQTINSIKHFKGEQWFCIIWLKLWLQFLKSRIQFVQINLHL